MHGPNVPCVKHPGRCGDVFLARSRLLTPINHGLTYHSSSASLCGHSLASSKGSFDQDNAPCLRAQAFSNMTVSSVNLNIFPDFMTDSKHTAPKFADNTAVVEVIHRGDESANRAGDKRCRSTQRCTTNNLALDMSKTRR